MMRCNIGMKKSNVCFGWKNNSGNHQTLTEYQTSKCDFIDKFLEEHNLNKSLQISTMRGGDDEVIYHTNRIDGAKEVFILVNSDNCYLSKYFEIKEYEFTDLNIDHKGDLKSLLLNAFYFKPNSSNFSPVDFK